MRRRRFGETGLELSAVGFGAWAIGGDRNATGNMGPADDDDSVAAIRRALDLGVNWIDTAPGYGCGRSEEVVGRAVKGLAEPPLIFTKCGFVWDDDYEVRVDITPASIRREVESSLSRLGVEALDLVQIHWVEPENDPEIEAAWETLAELRASGKVRHIGVSNFDIAQLERCRGIAPVESLQPPYSLLERGAEGELLPWCRANGVGVIAYSPMQSGLLTGAMTRARIEALPPSDARLFDPNFQEPLLTRNLAVVAELGAIAGRTGLSSGQLAVGWALANPAVSGAIVGFRTTNQVESILGAGSLELDEALVDELGALAG